jgi:hypothetical protein
MSLTTRAYLMFLIDQATGSWDVAVCCEKNPEDCPTSRDHCIDTSIQARQDFLFRLWPDQKMYTPKSPDSHFNPIFNRFQYVQSDYWPTWGFGTRPSPVYARLHHCRHNMSRLVEVLVFA